MAASSYHSLAIGSDDRLYAWGWNAYGQLGNGSTVDLSIPSAVTAYPIPASQTVLLSSANPSQAGQAVTFTATVTGSSPSGIVQFMDGTTNLGPVVTLSGGAATFSTNGLSFGNHSITVAYSGDARNGASVSSAVVQVVNQTISSTTLIVSPAAPSAGQTISLTAYITGSAPAGTVQFFDGAVSLGSVPVTAGQAVLTTVSLVAGSHSITAVYSGDTNTAGSTSHAATVDVAAGTGGNGDVPTLPEWGLILLALTLLVQGWQRANGPLRPLLVTLLGARGRRASSSR
jgi:hypothetical protein